MFVFGVLYVSVVVMGVVETCRDEQIGSQDVGPILARFVACHVGLIVSEIVGDGIHAALWHAFIDDRNFQVGASTPQ